MQIELFSWIPCRRLCHLADQELGAGELFDCVAG